MGARRTGRRGASARHPAMRWACRRGVGAGRVRERPGRPCLPHTSLMTKLASAFCMLRRENQRTIAGARRSPPSPRVRQFHLPRVVLGVFSGHGHLSHLSHPRGRPFKKFSTGIFVGWFVITPPPLPFPFSFFSRFNLGVAKVAKVAMSQKSHKVRVERSGATLGRRRVVNLLTQVRVYPPRRRSTCATRRGEMLYVVPRPAQSRPTRSACASLACSSLSSSRWPPRGWHPAGALGHRPDVRTLTRRDALRAAKTHPITPDMLGARVVGVLGSLIVAVGSQGVAPSGQCSLNRSLWAPRPSSALGWLS